jgi:hypothetical protein
MKNNSEISFYVDTMIVETLLTDQVLSKTAQSGVLSQLVEKVKGYVGSHIDPNDKSGSLLNILAPGAISVTFSALGLPWLGILFGLAMRVLNIDVKGILKSIWDKLKSSLGNDKQISSSEVDNIVNSSVQEHSSPATQEEADKAAQLMQQKTSSLLRDAKLLKLAMIEFDNIEFNKTAAPSSFLSAYSAKKASTTSLLSKVLSWIFKVSIASAGLMVAGDVINKFLGRPNALDGTIQNGKEVEQSQTPLYTSKQTKFKINTNYVNENKNAGNSNWVENVSNDKQSVESMLVNFAKQVYQGLDGLESIIRSSPAFQVIADRIAFYNQTSAGDAMVFIPKYFTSKKQIVDMFIDDVAEKAP